MDSFRPEYIDTVAASRLNFWLIPLLLLAPTLFAICVYHRINNWLLALAVIGGIIVTWLSLYSYSEHIWNTMELNARTDAEWEDVTSDTGRLFGPILVGIPFAIIYTLSWLGFWSFTGLVVRSMFRLSPRKE